MIPLRSDSATCADVDWAFTNNEKLMGMLAAQATRYAGAYGLDADDALQEVYLWLAVRPELHHLEEPLICRHTRQRLKQLTDERIETTRMEVAFEDDFDH